MIKKSKVIAFCFVALAFVAGCIPACFGIDVVGASEAINQAEMKIALAFSAVADAYNAGADVKELLEKLVVAGDFLTEANMAFRSGDFETAYSLALNCRSNIENLDTEAEVLMANVYAEKNNLIIWTVTGSFVGLILLVVLGIIGWRFLKRHYYERVFDMKPTVDES